MKKKTSASPKNSPLFLLTNDDGYFAPGLTALAEELGQLGQVYVVAPDREKSSVSLALTLRRPLRAEKIDRNIYAVDGTPADCVYIALRHILPRRPDLLVSGMNRGANLGCQDVSYSGTVAAALQGTFLGIPSIAVSLMGARTENGRVYDFKRAAALVRPMIETVLKNGLPPRVYLNINIPPLPVRGIKITRLGEKRYSPELVRKRDPRGKTYFWIGFSSPRGVGPRDSDVHVVDRGWISITPLQIDRTAHPLLGHRLLESLKDCWKKDKTRERS
ncbi:MAG: 5'/3'-nucleotidase SurE [Candidatus Saccharicenans sp.]|jgi:5'-nucleotidase|nr:5'/3'-nucleotidase SurE [Candidatus Saccharicenans sp.]MDH7575106.1 5'/3'-nucleotidase SurE [Candidatus Saccharicenans sp.]